MAGLGGFLKRHRMELILFPILAGEFYIWWRIQQMECYVPKDQRSEIFIKPLEYAQKLYGGSKSKDDHTEKKNF